MLPAPTNTFPVYCIHVCLFAVVYVLLLRNLRNMHIVAILLFISVALTFYTIAPVSRTQLESNPLDSMRIFRILVVIVTLSFSFGAILLCKARVTTANSIRLYFLFCAFASFSSLYSVYFGLSIFKAIELMADILLLFYISTAIKTSEHAKMLIDIFYASFVFLLLTAFLGIILYKDLALPWVRSDILPVRLRGALPIINSNELSQMATIVFIIALNRIVSKQHGFSAFQHIPALLLSFCAMVLSCSRTSIFAFVIVTLYITWHWRSFILFGSLTLLGVGIMVYNFSEIVTQYLLRGESFKSLLKLGGRMEVWPLFWQKFLDSPILGHGFYAAHRFIDVADFRNKGISVQSINTTDNTYIEIMLGLGMIGIIICILFLLTTYFDIQSIWKKIRNDLLANRKLRSLRVEVFAIFLIILIRSLTGPTFQAHTFNSLLLAGVMIAAHTMKDSASSTK